MSRVPSDLGLRRAAFRAQLQDESLLTEGEVAWALPGRMSESRSWVRTRVRPAGELAGTPVFRWRDVVAAGGDLAGGPVTRWKSAAVILGASEDTLARRRRERNPA